MRNGRLCIWKMGVDPLAEDPMNGSKLGQSWPRLGLGLQSIIEVIYHSHSHGMC